MDEVKEEQIGQPKKVQEEELHVAISHLSIQIESQNALLEQLVQNQTHVGKRLLAGLWTGLGTVLGATVVVSLLVLVLRPLAQVDWVGPIVNRVIDSLDRRRPLVEPPPQVMREQKQVPENPRVPIADGSP